MTAVIDPYAARIQFQYAPTESSSIFKSSGVYVVPYFSLLYERFQFLISMIKWRTIYISQKINFQSNVENLFVLHDDPWFLPYL